MKHFLTITNIQKDEKKSFTKEVKDYIEQKGGTCLCYYSSGNKERVEQIDPKQIPEGVECILVLGGDGTLIRAARDLYHWNIPMLGVNLGTLGYLCEVERSNIRAAIDEIMQEHYMIERRMMLEGYCAKSVKSAVMTLFRVYFFTFSSSILIGNSCTKSDLSAAHNTPVWMSHFFISLQCLYKHGSVLPDGIRFPLP